VRLKPDAVTNLARVTGEHEEFMLCDTQKHNVCLDPSPFVEPLGIYRAPHGDIHLVR
jgi:hypothetical protein